MIIKTSLAVTAVGFFFFVSVPRLFSGAALYAYLTHVNSTIYAHQKGKKIRKIQI
jgi:hypothetical protein